MGPGSIAFTGFNVLPNTVSQFNFVALEGITAGTTIAFTDNNWNGSAFTTNEATWTWTATSDVAAGTIVTLNDLIPGNFGGTAHPASNLGTVAYFGTQPVQQYQFAGETLYAYTGDAANPTFLTAFATGNLTGSELTNTSLVEGVNAVSLNNTVEGIFYPMISVYDGPTSGFSSFADYLAALHQSDNWTGQRAYPDAGNDGTHPDLPLPTDPLTVDPTVQTIGFAPDSVRVSVTEGQAGESTILTFTVVRSGSTEGAIDFSGSLLAGAGIDAADFGGTLPTFSGMIAAGATSAVVTITVSGDIRYESNETFDIVLEGGSNPGHEVVVGGSDTAHATITNTDQPQTVNFAAASQNLQMTEGNAGELTLTFTVERTGGTLGETTFTVVAPAGGSTANGDDFGGVFPFTGTIPDGQSSATFTLTINGDVRAELTEQLRLQITSVGNEPVGAIIGNGGYASATVTITNDDPAFTGNVIGAGEIVETPITVAGGGQFTVEAGQARCPRQPDCAAVERREQPSRG
ncbi:Calx-beta domain-containing protein [Bradyrhizobium sp. URHD0069]|uniref:Calx-beta domain-containing protein n=1 Tax=Bradyrhizobium sp. URHD0069 TaxID=1380355 RepID=UPI00049821D1|nr:Calx-beta domain-containing protein [Bradyrhizobium sp. URHD0069]